MICMDFLDAYCWRCTSEFVLERWEILLTSLSKLISFYIARSIMLEANRGTATSRNIGKV